MNKLYWIIIAFSMTFSLAAAGLSIKKTQSIPGAKTGLSANAIIENSRSKNSRVLIVVPGSTSFTIKAVKNAYVALSDEDGILHGAALTDNTGIATLTIIPFTSGNAKLVIYAPMYKPVHLTLPVIPGHTGPYPTVKNITVHNNNYAQNCFIDLELYNYGSAASNGLTVSASVDPADSVYAKVISQPVSYGNLAAADSMLVDSAVTIALSPNIPDQKSIKINLVLTDSFDKKTYLHNFNFKVNAPVLNIAVNTGEVLMPGCDRNLIYKISNSGHASMNFLDLELTQLSNLNISISNNQQSFMTIPVDSSVSFTFPASFHYLIPYGSTAKFKMTASLCSTILKSLEHEISVGSSTIILSEDFEGPWAPTGWNNNGWQQGTSEGLNGSKCAKSSYQNPTLKVLTTKNINIRDCNFPKLSFWWKDDDITKIADHDTTFCEITPDGTNWTKIATLSSASHETDYHQFVYNIPDEFATYLFKIRWRDRTDGTAGAWGTGLDNIEVTGFFVHADIETKIPQSTTIYPNYPNPFNPETTIRFYNQETASVKLTVFNLKGEMVADLVNRRLDQGFHDYKFNATGLASGVYIYKLQIGDQSMVKSMLLLK